MLPSAMRDRATIEAFADSVLKSAGSPRSIAMVAGMANAQLPGGVSPLMLATRHSDADKAVRLVNLLLKHGAELQTRDERGRHALMYACEHGASVRVVDCLLSWSRRLGPWALQWADRDCEGRDALVLAARNGHGQLASELLERIDLVRCPLENYPLAVLEAAIESKDEQAAAAVLQNSKIRREMQAGAVEKPRLEWQRTCNLSTCVQAAVRAGMAELVDGMLELNGAEVKRATWFAVYEAKSVGTTAEIGKFSHIAAAYRHGRMWDQVKTVAPLRRCSLLREEEAQLSVWERVRRRMVYGVRDWDAMEQHPLATMPSDVFASIMAFAGPSEEEDAREIRLENEARRCLECKSVCIPGECSCCQHDRVAGRLEDDLELW